MIGLGNAIASPLLWFLTKSAERGAQTPLYVALDDAIGTRRNINKIKSINCLCGNDKTPTSKNNNGT